LIGNGFDHLAHRRKRRAERMACRLHSVRQRIPRCREATDVAGSGRCVLLAFFPKKLTGVKSMSIRKTGQLAAVALSLLAATACSATRTQKTAGETLDDAVVTTRVKAALIKEPSTKARSIDVETFRGIVQLNGFVESSTEKNSATRVARGVDGVKEVRNNLSVRTEPGSAGAVVDDATLTGKVKAALIDSPDTKAHQINVETRGGVVQLSGFVNNAASKSAAARIARDVSGVRSVDNQIDVK
jgi:hyperosmotically inducible periplasmic protein